MAHWIIFVHNVGNIVCCVNFIKLKWDLLRRTEVNVVCQHKWHLKCTWKTPTIPANSVKIRYVVHNVQNWLILWGHPGNRRVQRFGYPDPEICTPNSSTSSGFDWLIHMYIYGSSSSSSSRSTHLACMSLALQGAEEWHQIVCRNIRGHFGFCWWK